MSVGVKLLGDVQHYTIMPVVALNVIVFLFLLEQGSKSLINNDKGGTNKPAADEDDQIEYAHARTRLEVFWTFAFIAATASVLQLVLPTGLADQIIAAWFVGQGFALQPYVQSFISGITVRNNKTVWNKLLTKKYIVDINGTQFNVHGHNVFTVTLKKDNTYRVAQWQELATYQFQKISE